MNPILSSTIDFDKYINDALNTKPNRPSSSSGSGRLSSSKASNSDAKTSSHILEMNSSKYSLNKRSVSGNNRLKPSEDILDALNMTHSWKGHLSSSYNDGHNNSNRSQGMKGISEVREGIASLNVNLPTPSRSTANKPRYSVDDDDVDAPIPNPPLAYSRQHMSPARPSASISSYSPARTTNRSAVDDDISAATESLEQYRRKTSIMIQTKYFRLWQIETKLSKGLLQTRSKIVARNAANCDWLLRMVLRDWRNLRKAVRFTVKFTRYQARKWLHRLYQATFRSNRNKHYAMRHYQHYRKFKGFQSLYNNYVIGRRLRKKHKVRHDALIMRRRHLLQEMMATWKKLVRKSKGSRHIIEEQLRRQEKIKQFVSKISAVRTAHESDATASELAAADAKDLRKKPTIYSAAASAGSSGTPNRVPSAGSERSRGVIGKPPLSGRSTANRTAMVAPAPPTTNSVRAVRPSSATAPLLAPLQTAGDCSEYDEEVFEQYEDESEGEVSPPPSFRTFMREEQELVAKEAFEKDNKASAAAASPVMVEARGRGASVPNVRSNNWTIGPSSAAGATERGGTAAASKNGPSDFEARAAERRLKTAALRKAAENRVNQRQKELEAQEKEKLAKEAKEAETIRKNSRLRIEQNKQNAVKLMETSEQMKKLLLTAKNFYRLHLLIQFGFGPWRRFMDQIRIDTAKAVQFYYDHLLLSTWSALVGYVVMMRTERYKREHRMLGIATAKYRRNLVKRMFRLWKLWHKMLKAKAKSVTGHFSRFTLFRRAFQGWKIAFERSQRYTAKRMQQVAPLGRIRALKYYWTNWKEYHESQLFEREVRYRVDDKWAKIQSWMGKK